MFSKCFKFLCTLSTGLASEPGEAWQMSRPTAHWQPTQWWRFFSGRRLQMPLLWQKLNVVRWTVGESKNTLRTTYTNCQHRTGSIDVTRHTQLMKSRLRLQCGRCLLLPLSRPVHVPAVSIGTTTYFRTQLHYPIDWVSVQKFSALLTPSVGYPLCMDHPQVLDFQALSVFHILQLLDIFKLA